MKCRDCENLIWSYAEGERIWQCRERYCPDLDIERDCPDFAPQKPDIFTAFSTLQADNERLRAELEQVKQERDAAVDCIYQIEDDLDRGNDNDWAREHIAEWESQKED